MCSQIIEESMNINADDLINMVVRGIIKLDFSDEYIDGTEGRFIKCRTGGHLISLCFHKTKEHSAIAEVHNSVTNKFWANDIVKRDARCRAPPGKWAAAWINSGKFGGNEAYYKLW